MEALVTEVQEILPLPRPYLRSLLCRLVVFFLIFRQSFTTIIHCTFRALLSSTKWDRQVLLETYYSDPERMFKLAALVDPDTVETMEIGSLDDSVDKECDICYLSSNETSPFLTNELCGHSFCQDCWTQHLQNKLEEGEVLRLACPASSCSILLADDLVKQVLEHDEKLALRLAGKKSEAVVERSPNLAWCPPGGCQRVVRLPADSLRSAFFLWHPVTFNSPLGRLL